jgi:hypothetical protein
MAVVQRSFAEFARARDAASQNLDDPAAALLARCRAYTAFALNAPGFPWPGPLEQMADQAVARLIGLDTPADTRPAWPPPQENCHASRSRFP